MTDPRPPVRVVVADDHPLFREGVVRALNSSGQATVVAEVSDGRTALDKIHEFAPDVALLDYKMPDLDGLEVLQVITRDGLPTRVVLLSAFDEGSLVYRALAEGAAGYLTKEAGRDEIVAAVIKCARGGEYLPASLASSLASEVKHRGRNEAALLSPRETEIITMIAQGLQVPKIAEQLHLAPSTIKTHIQNLYDKLGVSDRGAAVAEAMRRRLVQ
jgi:two-component system, NarL family, nitrate/nitrite response regulator NarL